MRRSGVQERGDNLRAIPHLSNRITLKRRRVTLFTGLTPQLATCLKTRRFLMERCFSPQHGHARAPIGPFPLAPRRGLPGEPAGSPPLCSGPQMLHSSTNLLPNIYLCYFSPASGVTGLLKRAQAFHVRGGQTLGSAVEEAAFDFADML